MNVALRFTRLALELIDIFLILSVRLEDGVALMASRRDKLGSMAVQPRYQVISKDQIDALSLRAQALPRRRVNWNLHASPQDAVHRFLNVMLHGTFVAPHRHITPPKPESFVVLEGEVAVIQFGEDGSIDEITLAGPDTAPRIYGIDLAAGVWHTLVVLSSVATIFEVKPGPYVADSDKHFAPWAPLEGDPSASEYLARLEAMAESIRATTPEASESEPPEML